jgi:DNA-binding NtrC family response regulator
VRHNWPGNVRELENAVERAVVLARRSRVDAEDLPDDVGGAVAEAAITGAVRPLADVERDYVLAALRAMGGNRANAARALGIGAATLYRKLRDYAAEPTTDTSVVQPHED